MFAGLAREIWVTFLDIAPYMLLGLTFAGVLHVFIHRDIVAKHLGGNNVASVIKAALFGVPLPLCSCGVLPVAMSLRKGKASEGATISFLISTPQTGIDSIVATWGMLGPVYAIFRPLAALIMGIAGGLAAIPFSDKHSREHLGAKRQFSCNLCFESTPHSHPFRYRAKRVFTYAFRDFLDDISVQLVLGIIISGAIAYFLPPHFFERYMGSEFASMLVMVALGIPMYICATASIPIAVALMMKGLSPGAAFVFLAVGSATNISFILVIADVMGRKILSVYLLTLVALSILMGFVLNAVFALVGTQSLRMIVARDFTEHASPWTVAVSAVFLLLLLSSMGRVAKDKIVELFPQKMPSTGPASTTRTVAVDGMTCHNCADHVTEELLKIENVLAVHADAKSSTVTIDGDAEIEEIREAVKRAGFSVKE